MKLVILAENTALSGELCAEHGLSLYLETGPHKILFDMGQSDAFARNAEKLGVDLTQVDFAVISHGHYDHGGGLETFLKINTKAPVYVHKLAFGSHYNAGGKWIGLDPALLTHPRLVFTEGTLEVAPGILLTDCNELGWESCSWGLQREEDGVLCPDAFFHEQYLQITEGQKLILISGCSHKGIVNIAAHFCPHVLVGGFHLNKLEDGKQLCAIAQQLKALNSRFYTGHCTGRMQYASMKPIMADKLEEITTGTVLQV